MSGVPWQLLMFRRSLKKQQKVKALFEFIDVDLAGKLCLDITHGDNTGSLNYCFREKGGTWASADLEDKNLKVMHSLLGHNVMQLERDHWSFADNSFDLVVVIDVLEHLEDPATFLGELRRVVKPTGSVVVTVPNGDPSLLVNKLRNLVGMTPEKYGHTRAGFTLCELQEVMRNANFRVHRTGGYSRFFTEIIELAINATYVLMFNKDAEESYGTIAPTDQESLKSHGLSFRLYSLAFPMLQLISKLDALLFRRDYYAVIVEGTKQ